jgi:nitrite reductase (NADH) large subunit
MNIQPMKSLPYSRFWLLASVLSVAILVTLVFVLSNSSDLGLDLLWNLIIPLAPIIFFLAPSWWVNVCPLAIVQSIPRRLKISKNIDLSYDQVGILQFFSWVILYLLVPARIFLFNHNAEIVLWIIPVLALVAFSSGVLFSGFGGWCSGLCPIRPVEMLYGQFSIESSRPEACRPCNLCQKSCSRLYGVDHLNKVKNQEPFKNQIYSFPGFVLGYFLSDQTDGIGLIYMKCLGMALLSWIFIYLVFRKKRSVEISAVLALLVYYGFTIKNVAKTWELSSTASNLIYASILITLGIGLWRGLRPAGLQV